MVDLTCAVIGLDGRGVIKTWTEVAATVRLYMLTSDLTSLVPTQFSHWLQVRNVGTVYFFIFSLFFLTSQLYFCACVDLHSNSFSYSIFKTGLSKKAMLYCMLT